LAQHFKNSNQQTICSVRKSS